jgi:para-nitrobenzyl esterase
MADEVAVDGGTLCGSVCEDGVTRRFLGIPYAAPPVGELRWRPPQPPLPWEGVREARAFGPASIQIGPAPTSLYFGGEEEQSEDCLNLNVWTGPEGSEGRPVMVWFHFGAFQFGSAANALYDGAALAAQGVTVVTVNYRLGRLGFLAHPELSNESGHEASGNYGLMDQIAALDWVRRNIASFGGDPGNVTLFGVSAGAHSIHCLRCSPLARGLFHKVIAESGLGFTHPLEGVGDPAGMQTLAAAEQTGVELAELLGASDLAELRALAPAQLLEPQLPRAAGPWGLDFLPPELTVGLAIFDSGYPIVDGYVLPEAPVDAYAAGRQIDVPMIAGSAGNESSGLPFIADPDTYREAVVAEFGELADDVLALYPADAEVRYESGRLLADRMFTWATWTAARLQAAAGRQPTWYYRFLREPPLPAEGEIAERDNARAFHGSELPYVFGTFAARDWPWTEADRELGRQVSSFWLNFARCGDPNGPGLPDWPTFAKEGERTLLIDLRPRVGDIPNRTEMALWDDYYAGWRGVGVDDVAASEA